MPPTVQPQSAFLCGRGSHGLPWQESKQATEAALQRFEKAQEALTNHEHFMKNKKAVKVAEIQKEPPAPSEPHCNLTPSAVTVAVTAAVTVAVIDSLEWKEMDYLRVQASETASKVW